MMSCSIGTVSGWLWPRLPGSLPWARLVVVTVLRLCSVGRVAELFSWDCHLCVSACFWVCLVHTYLYGPVVSGDVWVGHPPVHMHVVSISRLCLGMYCTFACLSVSVAIPCTCVGAQWLSMNVSWEVGTQLQFC